MTITSNLNGNLVYYDEEKDCWIDVKTKKEVITCCKSCKGCCPDKEADDAKY